MSGGPLVLWSLVVQFGRMVYRVVAAVEVLGREMSLGEEGNQKEGNGKSTWIYALSDVRAIAHLNP